MNLLCRDCFLLFDFSERDQVFYKKNGWPKPIRCPHCQKLHKEKLKDPYYGWESTMSSGFSRKQRHTRVHYAPHVVGGFR